ncbi:FAD/NAD(P)-binding domain-containing protein [Thozetella sp. PMI_491]|nr:FAD/NAD(P)-binding domain-containing protein [Thozetella sp. PMI_491]
MRTLPESHQDSRPKTPDERTVLLDEPRIETVYYPRPSKRRQSCSCCFLSILITVLLLRLANYLWRNPAPQSHDVEPRSVAVIGAGPAGLACALSLQKFSKDSGLNISVTVFEAADVLGGRLSLGTTVYPYNDAAQDPISAEDIAGNIILHENSKMRQAAERLLQRAITFEELPAHDVAYFDGEKLTSWETRPVSETSWRRWFSQSWQYGPFVVKSGRNILHDAKSQIARLSEGDLQSGIKEMLKKTHNMDGVTKTAQVTLDAYSLSAKYQHEVLDPQIRRILGIAPHGINALQLASALAAQDTRGYTTEDPVLNTLWELVALNSLDIRLGHNVTAVAQDEAGRGRDGNWTVRCVSEAGRRSQVLHFDQVVLSAPGISDLVNKPKIWTNVTADGVPLYRPVFVTFFATRQLLDPSTFDAAQALPKQILFVDSPNLGQFKHVTEISYLRPIIRTRFGVPKGEAHLYRAVMTDDSADVLGSLTQSEAVDWAHTFKFEHGYAVLYPQTSFRSFALDEHGLWQTSAIDSVGTSFDLSWMAGEAVAKQIIDQILAA